MSRLRTMMRSTAAAVRAANPIWRIVAITAAGIAVTVGIISHSWYVGIACVVTAGLIGAALDWAERRRSSSI